MHENQIIKAEMPAKRKAPPAPREIRTAGETELRKSTVEVDF